MFFLFVLGFKRIVTRKKNKFRSIYIKLIEFPVVSFKCLKELINKSTLLFLNINLEFHQKLLPNAILTSVNIERWQHKTRVLGEELSYMHWMLIDSGMIVELAMWRPVMLSD